MAPKKRATAASWRGKVGDGEDIELPSGNVALLKHIGMQEILAGDVIPDQLSPIVNESIRNKKGMPPQKLRDIAADPKQLDSMMLMLDRILTQAVLEPRVYMPPTCDVCKEWWKNNEEHRLFDDGKGGHEYIERREEGKLYADQVALEDKLFVMNYAVGGTGDLERFRKEHTELVDSISAGSDVEVSA